MSADNWGVCPKCNEKWEAETEAMSARVEEAYGKVPPEEYIRILSEYEARKTLDEMDTRELREDYELGINEDGLFYVIYSGDCSCGFHFKYRYEQKVYP